MPKETDLDVRFEEEPEIEYVPEGSTEEPEEDLPENVKKMSKKELYDKLKALEEKPPADPVAALNTGLERLAERLTPPESAVAPAAAPAGESEEEFLERAKVELFEEKKMGSVLKEAVARFAGPLLAQQGETNYQQAIRIMKLDPETGPVFKKFEGEILKYIQKNFPPQFHRNPQALEIAYKQVYANHAQDIAKERADAIVAERLKELELQRGLSVERKPLRLESGERGGTARPKITVTITKEDERIAEERGVSAEVVAAQRSRKVSGR